MAKFIVLHLPTGEAVAVNKYAIAVILPAWYQDPEDPGKLKLGTRIQPIGCDSFDVTEKLPDIIYEHLS